MANKQSGEGSSFRNSSTSIPQPKFYKIILFPHECSRLSIPEDFASRYCKNMQSPAYLEVPSGEVWEVEVVHFESQIWLAKGWQDFTDYYSISCGNFLMFGYNGRSCFSVTIFDLSAGEIEYPYDAVHGTFRAPKREELDDSIEILEDAEDDVSIDMQNVTSPFSTRKDQKSEIGRCPLGQSSKRKRQDGDSVYDVSVDMQSVDSPFFTRKDQKTSEGCRKLTLHDKDKAVMDKERAIAYQRAKAFKSKNPFVISFMQPSYVLSPFNLSVSLKFARKYLVENRGDLVLRVPGMGSWSVKCAIGTANAKIFWKAFVQDNKLKVGDVCVFEVIKGTKLIDVTIFAAAGSTSMHKIAGEVLGVSNNSLPCSRPKIVQTKKLKQQRGGPLWFNSKIKEEYGEGTEIEHAARILGRCPSGQGSKRKKLEWEAEDDVSFDIQTKYIKVEEAQEDVASPSFTRKTKKCGESSRMYKRQSKIVYRKNKTVVDKERTIGYQRAQAFKSKNPFIVSFMQPSYISTPYVLSIRLSFIRKYLGENCSKLILRVPGRGSWSVKCSQRSSDAKFLSGWKAFVLDNKLNVGDVCVFEVIKGTHPFLDVTIFRAVGSTPMDKVDAESPGVDAVSCSEPKVHIRKMNLEKHQRGDSDGLASKVKEDLGECTGKHLQQFDSSCIGRVVAQDMVLAYQSAEAFTSENPFFIRFMQPSYVSLTGCQMQLSITLSIARTFFPTRHSDPVLQVSSKRSWAVKCTIGKHNAKFGSGWKEFVLDNNIKVGDVCVFELVNRSKLLFNVIIFPAAEGV